MTKRKHPNKSRPLPKKKYVKYSQELPQFLDAESSITASRFGARRLPEMRTLWISFLENSAVNHDDEAYYKSGGCKLSTRHLRRRTGSHNRRIRHRFPTGSISSSISTSGEMEKETTVGLSGKNEDHLRQCKDDTEIKDNDNADDDFNKKNMKNVKQLSRRARRKPRLLLSKNHQWKNINLQQPSIGSETNWLETHLWHSKRFYMSPPLSIYNNWCIPLGHTNRGSRAAIRLSETKSTIQDATWSISGRCIILKTKKEQEDLIGIIEKICGGSKLLSAPFLTNHQVLQGLEVGYGSIYNVVDDTFPAGLLAAAFFIFGQEKSLINRHGCYFVRIFIQGGSIVEKVETMLKEVVTEAMEDVDACEKSQHDCSYELSNEAMCWIRVRGTQATHSIQKSLELVKDDDDRIDQFWSKRSDNNELVTSLRNLHTLLPHGTVMRMKCKNVRQHTRHPPLEKKDDDTTESQNSVMDDIVETIMKRVHFELTDTMLQENDTLLISQMPCPVDSTNLCHNNAVSGWDVLCSPTQTCGIFSALNNVGGSCAIGFIEDAAMKMEAEPPLPVWPRDFPDTAAGRQYWSGEHREWRVLRYCIEEGLAGGRLKTGLRRLLNDCIHPKQNAAAGEQEQICPTTISRKFMQTLIDWIDVTVGSSDIIEGTDSTKSDLKQYLPVVVRGSLITPFVQALCGFGKQYFDIVFQNTSESGEDNIKKRIRPRRQVRGKDISVVVPPIDKMLLEEQQAFCSNLLKLSTIPALLRCHLVAEGRGNMETGMVIGINTQSNNNAINTMQRLGYVVSGGFSQSRGRVHGVGIVSSKKFLSILCGPSIMGQLLAVSRQSQRTIGLKVTLQRPNDSKGITIQSMTASLTILL